MYLSDYLNCTDFDDGIKPPFSYYGGKQRMAGKILKLIYPHTVWVEPFCGSGSVMFRKGLPRVRNNNSYIEVLNDTNKLIFNFFKVCQDSELFEKLCHRLEFTPYSRDEYLEAKRVLKDIDSTGVDLAWAFYISHQMSFAGKSFGGWATTVSGGNHAVAFYNETERLKLFRKRLDFTYIDNRDSIDCIQKWDSPQTLFYLDPPYPDTCQGHYKGYSQADFENLIQVLGQIKGSFILSCYDNSVVPDDWERFEFKSVACAKGSSSNSGLNEKESRSADRIEVVWRKQSSFMAREELRPIMQQNFLDLLSQEDE